MYASSNSPIVVALRMSSMRNWPGYCTYSSSAFAFSVARKLCVAGLEKVRYFSRVVCVVGG
jgi:hypothetical protein